MKYKTKISPENGGYIGRAFLNDELAFTTNVHKDAVMAARELSSYIATAVPQPPAAQKPVNVVQASPNNLVPVSRNGTNPVQAAPTQSFSGPFNPPPRRCCGRG